MKKFKLSEIGEFKNGANFPKGSYGKGLKIVNVKDLFKGRYINEENLEELIPDAIRDKSIYQVIDGDILITRSSLVRSGAGMCAMIHKPKSEIVYCGFIIRYRITNKLINPLYVLYLLRSPLYRKIFTGTQQTNITNINQETLGQIEIDVPTDINGNPDLEEQKNIIRILDELDSKMENNENLCKKINAFIRTTYDYWFLQYQGIEHENLIWNDILKKEIPADWNHGQILDLFKTQSGYAFKSKDWKENGIPVLTIKAIKEDGSINMDDSSYIDMQDIKRDISKYKAENGNMLLAMSGNTIGKIGIIATNEKSIYINQRVLLIKSTIDKLPFSYYSIKNKNVQEYIMKLGSNSAQPNISEEGFNNIYIVLPKQELIDKFNRKFSNMLNEIIIYRKENEKLEKIKKYLLPLLMNGQVKL